MPTYLSGAQSSLVLHSLRESRLIDIQYCNPHNIIEDISEFKRGNIVGGSSVTRTASLCGVSRATVSRVMLDEPHPLE